MTLRQQAAALVLLKRWRDACIDRELAADANAHFLNLIALFDDTDQFLEAGQPDALATQERGEA